MGAKQNTTPPPEQDAGGLAEDELPSAQEAIPVPVVMGTRLVPARWISPLYGQRAVQREESVK